jgi:CRISPR-associated protein Csb2
VYAVNIQFPAGRYHATGWAHHVNEGTVEWPPSPFRLLRALVASGFKLGWAPERIRAAVLCLEGLPEYRLPPATAGHTRHYMPTAGRPTLVFDTFYAFSRGASLGVAWPSAEPSVEVRAELDTLWASVAYLGRAESWVMCSPCDGIGVATAAPGKGGAENARLLALEEPRVHAEWLASLPPPKKKAPRPPADAWEILLTDTGETQKQGWSRTPGVREVAYALRDPALVTPAREVPIRPRRAKHLALFALSSSVPPDIGRTVSVADRVRRAVMSLTTRLDDDGFRLEERRPDPDPLVAGRDGDTVLQGNRHAYWLPYSGDPRRDIVDRLLVAVPAGLSARAEAALRGLRRVWGDDQYDIHTVLLGFDDDAEVGAAGLVAEGRVWVTDTPFVPTRHAKPRAGRDLVPDQVRAGLAQLGFPDPVRVEPLEVGVHGVPWHLIQTERKGGGARAARRGVGVRLEFASPVRGPIAIGWGAHFGMGRFRRVE